MIFFKKLSVSIVNFLANNLVLIPILIFWSQIPWAIFFYPRQVWGQLWYVICMSIIFQWYQIGIENLTINFDNVGITVTNFLNLHWVLKTKNGFWKHLTFIEKLVSPDKAWSLCFKKNTKLATNNLSSSVLMDTSSRPHLQLHHEEN